MTQEQRTLIKTTAELVREIRTCLTGFEVEAVSPDPCANTLNACYLGVTERMGQIISRFEGC